MMNSDVDPLLDFLDEHWPGKFKGEDAAVWAREFQAYELEEVKTACITHKQNSRFRPYAREVREILIRLFPARKPREAVKAFVSRFKTVVASQWASTHPDQASDPESWLIMRYYRYWFFRARKPIVECAEIRKSDGRASLPDDESRIETIRLACVSSCKGDLIGCGLSRELAESASSWVVSTEPEFDAYLDELKLQLQQAA